MDDALDDELQKCCDVCGDEACGGCCHECGQAWHECLCCRRCGGTGETTLISGIEWNYIGSGYGRCPNCGGTGIEGG